VCLYVLDDDAAAACDDLKGEGREEQGGLHAIVIRSEEFPQLRIRNQFVDIICCCEHGGWHRPTAVCDEKVKTCLGSLVEMKRSKPLVLGLLRTRGFRGKMCNSFGLVDGGDVGSKKRWTMKLSSTKKSRRRNSLHQQHKTNLMQPGHL
jgi:hypothetical protein